MKKIILILVFAGISIIGFSQKSIQKAEANFNNRQYLTAIENFKKALPSITDNELKKKTFFKIAECYRLMNFYNDAIKWYEDALAGGYKDVKIYIPYGDVLARAGNLDKAISAYNKYLEKVPNDPAVQKRVRSCEFAKENLKSVNLYNPVTNESIINSEFSEFGLGWFEDYLMFASNRKTKKSKIDPRTGEYYSDIYKAVYNSTTRQLEEPVIVEGSLNTPYNDGTLTYDFTNKVMYIMQSTGYQGKGYINAVKYENGKWKKPVPIALNNKTYSIGHPTMALDGKTLYFVSDMPGGIGGKDIWKSVKSADGTWGPPVNLGDGVNTQGDELFPFILGDTLLFFTSDGHQGFGGLDIFCAKINADGKFVNPVNLGYPINTASDDFNLILREDTKGGFFCSNRPKGKGMDDIYSFPKFPSVITASGYITDFRNGNPISNAKVILTSAKNYKDSVFTDEQGKYKFNGLQPGENYVIYISADNYFDDEKILKTLPNDLFKEYSKESGTDLDFALIPKPNKWFTIKGKVIERITQVEMPGERLSVKASGNDFNDLAVSDSNGIYIMSYILPGVYPVKIMKSGYWSESRVCDGTEAANGEVYSKETGHDMDFELTKIEPKKEIVLNNIYYDFGKATLRPESKEELNKIVSMMRETPNITIEISSHTDARGDAKTNMKLSQARAKSVVDYLVSQGISKNRLVAKGYGKTKLLIPNAITEEEHQKNRRTSFTVIKLTQPKNTMVEPDIKITFMLQVEMSKVKLNQDVYFEKLTRRIPDAKIKMREEKVNNVNYYVYYIDIYPEKDLLKASYLRERIKNLGYVNTKLVALKDGKQRMDAKEALEYLSR